MKRKSRDSRADYTRQMRLAGVALAIPTLLCASPVVGYFLGWWAGSFLGSARAGGLAGLVLGFAAGVRETIRLVRRVQSGLK